MCLALNEKKDRSGGPDVDYHPVITIIQLIRGRGSDCSCHPRRYTMLPPLHGIERNLFLPGQ